VGVTRTTVKNATIADTDMLEYVTSLKENDLPKKPETSLKSEGEVV
jgi:hypothetical protein